MRAAAEQGTGGTSKNDRVLTFPMRRKRRMTLAAILAAALLLCAGTAFAIFQSTADRVQEQIDEKSAVGTDELTRQAEAYADSILADMDPVYLAEGSAAFGDTTIRVTKIRDYGDDGFDVAFEITSKSKGVVYFMQWPQAQDAEIITSHEQIVDMGQDAHSFRLKTDEGEYAPYTKAEEGDPAAWINEQGEYIIRFYDPDGTGGKIPALSAGKQWSLTGTLNGRDKNGKVVYEPYRIKVLNTINFKKSMHYNPFAYIHSEKDILKLVTTLIANTKGEGKAGDDFWVKAETLLYCALIGYIHYEAPVEEQNFATLIEFINAMEVREDDEEFKNPVDLMFDALEAEKPNHFAVRQYKKYKLAAGKTAKSILISCGARLAVFDIAELREVTSYDELELDTLGDRKTALFLIMSDTDDSFNFLISMCYTQLFNLLCEKADDVYGGRLPVHVRCLIDECANIGQIPKLEKLVATIRSREISACLVLQAQSQLKAIYKDNADTIIGNMDTSIFLGGKEPTTLKELEAVLGKETIDTYNTGESRGRETSHSLNYQKLGKSLMSQDELAVMDGGKCILQLRGVRPFLSDKYDITKHPNFKYTADADDKNAFDIEAFLSARLKLKPNEVCDVYEVDTKGT